MSKGHFAILGMSNVYYDGKGKDPAISLPLYLQAENNGSLIIDDHPQVDGGMFNIVIENQNGVPWLHVWTKDQFGNDPLYSIDLHTGKEGWVGDTEPVSEPDLTVFEQGIADLIADTQPGDD